MSINVAFQALLPLLTMSNHPSGDSEPPSPRDTEAAGSPGGEASAESSTAQTAQGAHGAEQDDDFDSDSVADSAIETDILSTMTAPDEFFAFIEENGRTYHSYKASSRSALAPNHMQLLTKTSARILASKRCSRTRENGPAASLVSGNNARKAVFGPGAREPKEVPGLNDRNRELGD